MAAQQMQQPMLGVPDEAKKSDAIQWAKPWPLSSKVCMCLSCVVIAACAMVCSISGIGPRLEDIDPSEVKMFHRAKLMLLPALLLESCYLISSRNSSKQLKLQGSEMSYLVILEYVSKMVAYSCMAYFKGGVVHKNMLAVGPVRPCYTVRYIEWAIAVPPLLVINNYPLVGKQDWSVFIRRWCPNLFITVVYISSSWLAQVTPNPVCGWSLVLLSFLAYSSTVFDQIRFVCEAQKNSGWDFKVAVVIIKEVSFSCYGMTYLLGATNLLSSSTEQLLYTYGDIILKVVQASVLMVVRNWEDLAELQEALEFKVEMGKEDRRRFFHCANAPIFAITQKGVVSEWNEHIEKVSGIREEDAIGKCILDLVDKGSRDGLKNAIESCNGGMSSGSLEITMQRQSSEQPPVQMLVALIEQIGSEPVKTITAIGQDLTEVSAMKAMNERKARFTATLGHELRSPLHGIMGLSASMAEGASNAMQKRQLSMIKGCAARLLDLVTNIMEMAKAEKMEESGAGATLVKRSVNMMDLVDEVIGMTDMAVDKNGRHLVGSNVIMVNNMCKGKLPVVVGDPYKITQLLYNLVTNAAKFTVAGSIQLGAREDREKSMLEIGVSDTGKGIEPQAMKRIFEPFQQQENKDSRNFQGIGLGLSVAMSIARLHGGEIRVTSKPGQGSTFTVVLPCDFNEYAGMTLKVDDSSGGMSKHKQGAAKGEADRRVPRGGVMPPAGQRPLALSVDDDDINQEVIEQNLGSEYRIVRAMNGMEAFQYLDSGKEFPSLMLLDVMMPGMPGFEVVKEIRNKRNISHTELPVVMLSARSPQEATANDAFANGATDYMQKPFSAMVLKHRLNVIDEVRQAVRKAELGAVEAYKADKEKKAPAAKIEPASEPVKPPQLPPSKKERAKPPAEERQEDPAAMAARAEAIKKLTQERDQLKGMLESKQQETEKANTELKRLVGDRDRLKAEIVATVSAAAAAAKVATTTASASPEQIDFETPSHLSTSRGIASAAAELDFAQSRSNFYQAEVDIRDRQIADLRRNLDQNKCDAYIQRQRADAIDRELRFVRQLRNRLSTDLPPTP